MKMLALPILAAWAAVWPLRAAFPAGPVPAPDPAAVLRKILARRPVTRPELESLSGAVVVLREKPAPEAAEGGSRGPGRISVFRVEKRNDAAAFARGEAAFLRGQRTALRVLSAIVEQQLETMARLARQENVNRELLLGIRSLGRGWNDLRAGWAGGVSGPGAN